MAAEMGYFRIGYAYYIPTSKILFTEETFPKMHSDFSPQCKVIGAPSLGTTVVSLLCCRQGHITELYVGTGRSHAHSGLTPTHHHLACVLLLYSQCPVPVLLWQLWSGSATYQICFRLTIPNPNHKP